MVTAQLSIGMPFMPQRHLFTVVHIPTHGCAFTPVESPWCFPKYPGYWDKPRALLKSSTHTCSPAKRHQPTVKPLSSFLTHSDVRGLKASLHTFSDSGSAQKRLWKWSEESWEQSSMAGRAAGFGKGRAAENPGLHSAGLLKYIFILRNWVTSEMYHLFKLQEIMVYSQRRAWQTSVTKNNGL